MFYILFFEQKIFYDLSLV